MYKTKPCFGCNMPSDAPLNVLALNASLKHDPLLSNTGELASLVLEEMRALGSDQRRTGSPLRHGFCRSDWVFVKRRRMTGRAL